MLDVADVANVAFSSASTNNNLASRFVVFHSLCKHEGLDLSRINFFAAPKVYELVEDFANSQVSTTVVLGADQTQLGERLSRFCGVKFVPNEVRVGSSSVIRYFIDNDQMDVVTSIYHNDYVLVKQIQELYKEELAK